MFTELDAGRIMSEITTPSPTNMFGDTMGHLHFVYQTARDINARTIVDLGVHYGGILTALLCAAKLNGGHVYSCDLSDYPETRKQVGERGLADIWSFDVIDDRIWATLPECPTEIELLSIDTHHIYDLCSSELALYAPKMKLGGMILLHDSVSFPPVLRAIGDFLIANKGWAFYNRTNCAGMGVMTRMTI